MIPYEENIIQIVKKFNNAFMPETSNWNPIGITEEEAQIIAQRNGFKLKILPSTFLPEFRVFKFLVYSIKRNRPDNKSLTEENKNV